MTDAAVRRLGADVAGYGGTMRFARALPLGGLLLHVLYPLFPDVEVSHTIASVTGFLMSRRFQRRLWENIEDPHGRIDTTGRGAAVHRIAGTRARAVLDGDGSFRLVDRNSDLIIVVGYNEFPSVTDQHPDGEELAVVGRSLPVSGGISQTTSAPLSRVPE